MDRVQSANRSPYLFFLLVFLLSVPFWILIFWGERFLPDVPANLPITAPMVLIPMIAAAILVYRESGREGVKALLRRAFDWKKIPPAWYLPIFLLLPLIMVLSYTWLRLAGSPLPDPEIPLLLVPVYLLMFAIAGIGEELGYSADELAEILTTICSPHTTTRPGIRWSWWHEASIDLDESLSAVWPDDPAKQAVAQALAAHAEKARPGKPEQTACHRWLLDRGATEAEIAKACGRLARAEPPGLAGFTDEETWE